jgi:putative polyketide hydroxylase
MDTPVTETSPVLIVGGSPVGLSTAVFLAHHGVPTTLVERHAGSSLHPRAIGYTTRTIELFRAAGIQLPPSTQGGPPRRARVESLNGRWHEEYPWSSLEVQAPAYDYSPVPTACVIRRSSGPNLAALVWRRAYRPSTVLCGKASGR